MSDFLKLLSQPLPSKAEDINVTESVDDASTEEVVTEGEECGDGNCAAPAATEDADLELDASGAEDVGTDDIDDILGDDFDDLSNYSDEDLAAFDDDLSDEGIDAISATDEPEVKLSPSEEIEADDMMSSSATALLVKDELNTEEKTSFVQDPNEAEVAVKEGFLSKGDLDVMAYEAGLVTEAQYGQKMIIKLDKKSKLKQLFALAVNISAAAHNDPDYKKLKKVYKAKRVLRARLSQKYKSEATKRMKVYFARLKNSKSSVLSKIASRVANKAK